jgi:hypothetical protein
MTIESQYQVPTVALHTHVFERVVRSTARFNGMPGMRTAFVPQPVMGKTAHELRAYIDGIDPVTRRPVVQEIVEGLTRPFRDEELLKAAYDRSTPRLVEPATEDELRELFVESHWTDHLPIVLPTEERVEAMLECTSRGPDDVVGRMRPTHFREAWEYTVEKVAVNAVMAGAKPAYFPVILAMAASGATARGSTTSSAAAMAIVNGPIRHEIGMSGGIGAMGPYNHANATIGRAYGLLSQNLQGGSEPGLTYMGSQGNGYAFSNVTFAENEEASPWEPFHVTTAGMKSTDNAVSVFGGVRHTAFTLGVREKHWRDHVRHMLLGMDPREQPLFVLDPIAARLFAERGPFATKTNLEDWAHSVALMKSSEYWDYQLIQNYVYPRATYGEEPYASMLKSAPDELIPMFPRDAIRTVVVGGETNGYWRIFGASYAGTVSVDDWR